MMETEQQNKSSVIAKLMCFDEAPCQQQPRPVCNQPRVFSENYLLKVASLGSHDKRSRIVRRKAKVKKNLINLDSFDGMQCSKSSVDDSQTIKIEKRYEIVLRPDLGNAKQESRPCFLRDSCIGWEVKKLLLERSKRTTVCQEIWSSKQACKRGEAPSKLRSELGASVVISNYDGWKNKSATKIPIFKRFKRSPSSNTKFKNMSKADLRLSSVNRVSENSQDAEFACSFDVSYENKLRCEEGFAPLHCVDMDEEVTRSAGEAYQPSPNSVLEPDNSSSSEYGESVCTDLHGLWMKLRILKSESEEDPSNKSESVVLSNEDATESSVFVGQNIKPIRWFGPKESQQFSYLVNVLDELRLCGVSVELDLERSMTNPVIFNSLEKKYENEKSWYKADRRLLFDRINLGLTEMVWSKPLRRKMSNVLKRNEVEEELWDMLVSQEKEVNADLSKKAVGKETWLELQDEVDSIVVEIEAFLFDELVAELVAI